MFSGGAVLGWSDMAFFLPGHDRQTAFSFAEKLRNRKSSVSPFAKNANLGPLKNSVHHKKRGKMDDGDVAFGKTKEQRTLVVSSELMRAIQNDVDCSEKKHKSHLLTCILAHCTLPFEMHTLHKQFVPLCVVDTFFTGKIETVESEKAGFFVQFSCRENLALGINCELESGWGDCMFLCHPPNEIVSTEKSRKDGLVFPKRHFLDTDIQDFRLVDASPVCVGTDMAQHLNDRDTMCPLEFHFGSSMCEQMFSDKSLGMFEHFFDIANVPRALSLKHNFGSGRDNFATNLES